MDRNESLTIEEYQLILMRDPSSKVFAPLAEAYRKMGLVQQALEICERGVQKNPNYVSGLVAYGKILIELENYKESIEQLKKAVSFKSDNVLANRLLGLAYQKLGHPELALKYFKTLLYLKPNDTFAEEFVNKWGFLETQKIDPSVKEVGIFKEAQSDDHFVKYVDALGVNGERELALSNIEFGLQKWPDHPLLKQRRQIIEESIMEPQELIIRNLKKRFYELWLHRADVLRKKMQSVNLNKLVY